MKNSYSINYSDTAANIPAIEVSDYTTNTDSSLQFPGRFVTDYAEKTASNFLHLLENFASGSEPRSPKLGQLWYDKTNNLLKINARDGWESASGIEYKSTQPGAAVAGKLWVDTNNNQLNIYTGNSWMVVGPAVSSIDGLKNGAMVEQITDSTNNQTYSVLTVYISDVRVAIISKVTIHPNPTIPGYSVINPGINLNSDTNKFTGNADSANSLMVGTTKVDSDKFFRKDNTNITTGRIVIQNNDGLTIGTASDLVVTYNALSKAAKIFNSTGGSVELQTSINHEPKTILKVAGESVYINATDQTQTPNVALDVHGDAAFSDNVQIDGNLNVSGHINREFITSQVDLNQTISQQDMILLGKSSLSSLYATTVEKLVSSISMPSRKTISTTVTVAGSSSQTVKLTEGFKSYALYSVKAASSTNSSNATITVYTSDAPSAPVIYTSAIATNGVIHWLAPALLGYNSDSKNEINIKIENTDTVSKTITVELTILKLEA